MISLASAEIKYAQNVDLLDKVEYDHSFLAFKKLRAPKGQKPLTRIIGMTEDMQNYEVPL